MEKERKGLIRKKRDKTPTEVIRKVLKKMIVQKTPSTSSAATQWGIAKGKER